MNGGLAWPRPRPRSRPRSCWVVIVKEYSTIAHVQVYAYNMNKCVSPPSTPSRITFYWMNVNWKLNETYLLTHFNFYKILITSMPFVCAERSTAIRPLFPFHIVMYRYVVISHSYMHIFSSYYTIFVGVISFLQFV